MALKFTRIAILILAVIGLVSLAQAQDPCAAAVRRALVLSGGGIKGAFEVGALFHLIVDRGCDFQEISGISVGGLNAAFLAQARVDSDPAVSHDQIVKEAEALVDLWNSIRGSRDIYRHRRLATIRAFVGNADSFNDFTPLGRLIKRSISVEQLRNGRTVRVGVVAVRQVRYREVISEAGATPSNFLDYVYAGAVLPVIGHLPRIIDDGATVQYGDATLRHITPILSYFRFCAEGESITPVNVAFVEFAACDEQRIPKHRLVEQLFVLLTSPYTPGSDLLPQTDVASRQDTGKVGVKKMIPQIIAALNDNTYRAELDMALFANHVLAWPQASAQNAQVLPFHLDSYNSGQPYNIAIVAPKTETVDFGSSLEFPPAKIRQLMHDGCIAADAMMHDRYGLVSIADACERRFQRLQAAAQLAMSR
jgi:hypothetical protein